MPASISESAIRAAMDSLLAQDAPQAAVIRLAIFCSNCVPQDPSRPFERISEMLEAGVIQLVSTDLSRGVEYYGITELGHCVLQNIKSLTTH